MTARVSFPGLVLAIAASTLLAAPALAQSQKAQPTKAERIIKYRQSALYLLGWNIGPVGAMVKGEIPFDAKAVELIRGAKSWGPRVRLLSVGPFSQPPLIRARVPGSVEEGKGRGRCRR